jgi:phosphonoacetate hydrolase
MNCSTASFSVNNRSYHPPNRPLAAICLDGSADEYLDHAMALGRMPRLQRAIVNGAFRGMARGALPSFTNINNSCIVTGVPPSVHGIGGNFFYDPATGQEVMMNSAKYLRCGTILAAAAKAGRKVGVVTAKEKLRDILSHELTGAAFSSEKAREAKQNTHGIENVEELVGFPTPPIYSPDASLFVLRAGVAMLQKGVADFLYLSLTDFMQHKFAPEAPEAVQFYADIDTEIGRLIDAGAIVAATADHGMNAKQNLDGSPNVIYLEDLLNEKFGGKFRVILPITDPYVRHHGALGSFAVVHLPEVEQAEKIRAFLNSIVQITEVYTREEAVLKLELPGDRLGDLVVMCARNVVLGRSPAYHDLAALDAPLRSHGGRYEEMVPFIISEPLNPEYRSRANGDLRNFDLFEFLTNGTTHV